MSNHITKNDFEDAISFFKNNKTTTFGGVIMHEYQVDVIRKELIELANRSEKAEAENARLRDYIITVAKFAVDLGYQSGHEHTVDGHYAPPSQYDYDIFDGIDLMNVES